MNAKADRIAAQDRNTTALSETDPSVNQREW
jgi:hypothetical protein